MDSVVIMSLILAGIVFTIIGGTVFFVLKVKRTTGKFEEYARLNGIGENPRDYQLKMMADDGFKIIAMKVVFTRYGGTLQEAKEYIESLQRGETPKVPVKKEG